MFTAPLPACFSFLPAHICRQPVSAALPPWRLGAREWKPRMRKPCPSQREHLRLCRVQHSPASDRKTMPTHPKWVSTNSAMDDSIGAPSLQASKCSTVLGPTGATLWIVAQPCFRASTSIQSGCRWNICPGSVAQILTMLLVSGPDVGGGVDSGRRGPVWPSSATARIATDSALNPPIRPRSMRRLERPAPAQAQAVQTRGERLTPACRRRRPRGGGPSG